MEALPPSNSLAHLALPDNQAALAPFPPGCPVLVSGIITSGETSAAAAAASSQTYLGQVHSVYIDLGSTTRDNFYRVRPSSAAPTEAAAAINAELRSAAESALKYAPGCTVTVNASALPPFVANGGGNTRDATIISCVGGGVSGSNSYYLLDVMPGPGDSWTNIQSTVPVDSVRYRVSTEESLKGARVPEAPGPAPAPAAQQPAAAAAAVANDDNNNDDHGARVVISPHPHTIPTDEDGSSLNSSCRAPPVPSITINTDRKRSAEQLDCDGGSSTLSPMPTDGSISIASSNAIIEQVVRRIDIPETVDASKIKEALVGPDFSINLRMQAKFQVTISILGLDDAIGSNPGGGGVAIDEYSKLGPISYKVGDKCIMIRGPERKVHDAAKVVIHMLVNKCYEGNDKNALTRELRVVRQVRKKAELSPRSESARADLPSPPKKKIKAGPTVAEGDAASMAAEANGPVERGWSPPIEEGPQPQISSAHSHYGPSSGSAPSKSQHHPTFSSACLVSAPVWIGSDWQVVVKSPIPRSSLFGRLVGKGSENKKQLERKFSDVLFNIRGEGIPLRCGKSSEGPLRVEVEGSDKDYVSAAAQYVAEILHSDSHSMTKPGERPPSACQQLIMGKPSFDDGQWHVEVKSPLDPHWNCSSTPLGNTETFKRIIGEGGSKKKEVLSMIKGECFFALRGGGIRDQSKMPTDGPLRVYIKGLERAVVENAAEYFSRVLANEAAKNGTTCQSEDYHGPTGARPSRRQAHGVNEAGGTANSSHPDRSICPASAIPVDTQYGRQEWKTTVFASSVLLGDTSAYFGGVVGPGGSILRNIQREFGVNITVLGEGVSSTDLDHNPRDPMNARIVGPSRHSVDDAALHIARVWDNVAGATTNSNSTTHNHRDNERRRNYDEDISRRSRQQVMDPYHDGKEWVVEMRSQICQGSLFGTIIGSGSAKKKEIVSKFPHIFLSVTGDGIRGPDGRRDDGPLRVIVRGSRRDEVAAASIYVADLIDFRYHVDRIIIEEPFLRGNSWHVRVESPLPEQVLFDTIVGRGGIVKKRLVEEHGGIYINIRGGGLKGASYGNFDEDRAPLHVDISSGGQDEKQKILDAAISIAKILVEEAKRQRRL